MTLITQIEDRGAVVAWCPLSTHADLVALGLKDSGGGGFDTTSYGSELEVYNLSITDNESDKPKLLGSIKTTSRFASIGWCNNLGNGQYPMGLVAGGMEDGVVHIWDPNAIVSGASEDAISTIVSKQGTSGSNVVVTALQFNPHCPTELGIGYSNGEVTVMSLDDPLSPSRIFPLGGDSYTPMIQGGEITKLSWNTQVSHILASACSNGIVAIYDVKAGKLWCELRCESTPGATVSDVAWNPTEGLHIMTASGDDRNPVMKLWDCRASTTVPLATLAGHSQGILSMAWCPHDPSLLLSCGKDNKTLLWDLYALKPVHEFPSSEATIGSTPTADDSKNSVFGSGLSSSQQRRYYISWSPIRRGLALSCSFDRKVQVHSVIGAAAKTGRTPQWMSRPNGVSTGFGGTIVSFNATYKYVTIAPHVEEPELVKASNAFEQEQASKDYINFCNNKATNAASTGDAEEAKIWGFMQIIFEANAREQLLQYLGFDPEEISQMAYSNDSTENNVADDMGNLSLGQSPKKNVDEVIKQALIVGNFEAAVECCFQNGNYADGLVLSSCGGADLWQKTQARYFELETQKRPFLSIVSAVINNKLEDLVMSSDPTKWRETLAIISTYGKTDEFPALCLSLGNRLEEAGDTGNASLCFMCALCLDKAVKFWKIQLDSAGGKDIMALHAFMEKVTTFLQALDPSVTLSPTTLGGSDVMDVFYDYAKVLADQGLLETSARYCRGESQACMELLDRLYHSRASQAVRGIIGATPPVFPFLKTEVNVARARTNYGNRNQQQPSAQPTARASDELPPGWLALQDPSSGMTYYANQNTGETTWDRPSPPAPAPAPMPQQTYAPQPQYPGTAQQQQPQQQYSSAQQASYTSAQQPQYQSSNAVTGQANQQPSTAATSNGMGASPSSTVASKYGDGFVTSASHPELASRYGNVGTSNPYTGVDRPGIAVVPGQTAGGASTQPVATKPFDPNDPPQVPSEQQHVSDTLISIIQTLSTTPTLLATEKKQLAESTKAVGVLLNKLSQGALPPNVIDQVNALVTALQNRDYATATAVQTSAVSSIWRDHKDWLKGMKFLIQLASRRLQ